MGALYASFWPPSFFSLLPPIAPKVAMLATFWPPAGTCQQKNMNIFFVWTAPCCPKQHLESNQTGLGRMRALHRMQICEPRHPQFCNPLTTNHLLPAYNHCTKVMFYHHSPLPGTSCLFVYSLRCLSPCPWELTDVHADVMSGKLLLHAATFCLQASIDAVSKTM